MRKTSVLLLAMGILVAGCIEDSDGTSEVDYHGLEYEPPLAAADFTLTDQNSNEVSFSDFSGKVVIVAFTYTHCPDACLSLTPTSEPTRRYASSYAVFCVKKKTINPLISFQPV